MLQNIVSTDQVKLDNNAFQNRTPFHPQTSCIDPVFGPPRTTIRLAPSLSPPTPLLF